MVDLWKQQARANINCNPSPRDGALSALLKLTKYEEDERKRKNFEDRGADTLLDGYTTMEQIQQIACFFWSPTRDYGKQLRNLLAFLLGHYALMRGESARMMELADLHSIMLENEGYTPCRALVMVMRHGRTNQVGRIELARVCEAKAQTFAHTDF
ncbi:Centromere DNA-binding protein complex CBF3 subunit [Phytophthora infestans]|uniref:Centromere DNA-binding protein complex CBF3 subunit n=1 Tax=Phytophthora infestans TaxID=4787 RepID=A0A833SMN7_PHYIN|nr:Centromere DNA-binding protein complex CBF3 subunit [Phytophthora infestans]